MRILIAPDSFKGTLTAAEAAEAMAQGVRTANPDAEIDICPLADGGEGTLEVLSLARKLRHVQVEVTGPAGKVVTAHWGLFHATRAAIIESAQAAGLPLVPPGRRDPARTTTWGVGEMILDALDHGAAHIVVCLGGSATNDGGMGMAQALGARFDGVPDPATGMHLRQVRAVDLSGLDPRLSNVEVAGLADVLNPLTGPSGAAATYAPQKGATADQVRMLDEGLSHLTTFFPDVDPDIPGAGAAGGMGFGLMAILGAEIGLGIGMVMGALRFEQRAARADLVLTGEGRLDAQSTQGKVICGVALRAEECGVPVVAVCGSLTADPGEYESLGLLAAHEVRASGGKHAPGFDLEQTVSALPYFRG